MKEITNSNSGLAEAIQKLIDTTAKPGVQKLHTTETHEHYLVTPGGGAASFIQEYPREAPALKRTMLSRDSFEHYVKTHKVENKTECYVDDKQVLCLFQPNALNQHTATMPLDFHEDYEALLAITRPLQQKPLWRILSTLLIDRVPNALLLMVNELKHTDSSSADVSINATGLGKASYARDITVNFKDNKNTPDAKEVQVDWEYNGPIFDCTDQHYTIKLRMELSVPENGGALNFQFHTLSLGQVLRQARADLRDSLAEALSPIPIYDGH